MSDKSNNSTNIKSLNSSLHKPPEAKLMSLNDFISGSVAGVVQVLLGQPFDMLKVRMQTRPDQYKSVVDCFTKTLSQEGPFAFYKGTLSPLLGISFCVGIQFGSNELAKNYMARRNFKSSGNPELSVKDYMISGMFAGICNSFVMSPVELIRIKLQVQGNSSNLYSGTIDCVKKIAGEYGIKGIYQGLSATIFREIPAYAVYFGAYETLMGRSIRKYKERKNIPLMNVTVYGAVAGVLLWVTTFPHDVIKSRMQADDIGSRKYPSIASTIRSIHAQNGISGFFNGIVPCLMRAPLINAATFLTFELVQKSLSK